MREVHFRWTCLLLILVLTMLVLQVRREVSAIHRTLDKIVPPVSVFTTQIDEDRLAHNLVRALRKQDAALLREERKLETLRHLEAELGVLPGSLKPVRDVFYRDSKLYGIFFHSVAGLTNLTPLSSLRLEYLRCPKAQISDLSPLRNMPIESLWLGSTQISDLTPIRHCPIRELNIGNTRVTDISPLHGMPLEYLQLNQCSVSSIAALAGMPLKKLLLTGTDVSDLTPLKGMQLERLDVDISRIQHGKEIIQNMKSLKMFNGRPLDQWDMQSFELKPAEHPPEA